MGTPPEPVDTGPPPKDEGMSAGERREGAGDRALPGETEDATTATAKADEGAAGPSAPSQLTWSDRVQGNGDIKATTNDAMLRSAHIFEGVWNPLHLKQLKATLLTDWSAVREQQWTAEEREMRQLALAPANTRRDDCIRPWTADENETMVAYLDGRLGLPHPPNFVKEILVHGHRAMLEDYHEEYFNYTLTANLPPSVRLPRMVPHAELFKELFRANTDKHFGVDMMRALQQDAKRVEFDSLHTLSIVFYSQAVAERWMKKALRFQKAVIVLQDTKNTGAGNMGIFTPAQVELQYAVRVYGAGEMGLARLTRAIEAVVGAKVLDVEYARTTPTETYDNRFHTITFAQTCCPDTLADVTRVEMDGTALSIHHFQTHLRRPCGKCYSPRHGGKWCTVSHGRLTKLRQKFTRVHTGTAACHEPVTREAFHVDSLQCLVDVLTNATPVAPLAPQALLPFPGPRVTVGKTAAPLPAAMSEPAAAITAAETSGDGVGCGDGYTVHLSKRSKNASKKAHRDPTEPGAKQSHSPAASHDDSPVKGKSTPAAAKGSRSGTASDRTSKRFTSFQRAEARGYYADLAEQEESDSESEAENMMDDAPYAFEEAKDESMTRTHMEVEATPELSTADEQWTQQRRPQFRVAVYEVQRLKSIVPAQARKQKSAHKPKSAAKLTWKRPRCRTKANDARRKTRIELASLTSGNRKGSLQFSN